MKNKIITTQIKVPSPSNYSWTNQDRKDKQDFEDAIIKELGLPDNWNKYLEFKGSNTFVSLVEKGGYKVESFRKFSRNSFASYPDDLKERLTEHIQYEVDKEKRAQERKNSYDETKKLICAILDKFQNDEYSVILNMDKVIEIELKDPTKEYSYYNKLGHCSINQDNTITQPVFKSEMIYREVSIKYMQEWIVNHTEYHNKLIAKAKEIKAALPESYFITDPVEN